MKRCQQNIPYMKNRTELLTSDLSQDYEIPEPIIKQLYDLDLQSVVKTTGVLNTIKLQQWLSWGHKLKAEEMIKKCKKRTNHKPFSLDYRFLQLTKLIITLKKFEGIEEIPGPTEIHNYIDNLEQLNSLHFFHSPNPDKPEMVGIFNLLFLIEYLKLVPHIVKAWLEYERKYR